MSQLPSDYYQQPWRLPRLPRPPRPAGSPRPRRSLPRKRSVVLLAPAALLLVVIIVGAVGCGTPAASSATTRAATLANAKAAATAKAARACGERPPASRDIYVRIIKPGTASQVRQLSGRWRWDHTTGKCLTAVHFMAATAPRGAGHCTQVGYVTDNPGYDPNARPAPAIPHLAAVPVGPACAAAAAPSSAAPSSAAPPSVAPPSVAPPPPAPATPPATAPAPASPTGCYPLSDEGTCYEPGEYCRDDDHGVTGVAGDGEAIICEDNDGWRWEPAN
jgi:hypothetical protein